MSEQGGDTLAPKGLRDETFWDLAVRDVAGFQRDVLEPELCRGFCLS